LFVLYLLVSMGVLEACTGFSLNHLISIGGSLGATSPHTTEPGLREEPSPTQPDDPHHLHPRRKI